MAAESPEQALYAANPAMVRNHPLWFTALVLMLLSPAAIPFLYFYRSPELQQAAPFTLGAAALSILILLYWWVACKTLNVRLDESSTRVVRGILSKTETFIRHERVRTVEVYQSLFDRIFGTGRVTFWTAGDQPEIVINGMPQPRRIQEIVNSKTAQGDPG
ncbi:hypothetical protein CKO28_00465 [Rhodovibrio sodomensis]|uniref:YdbS-like PH domain-containing protein n=1 Tax=Rhodovibrio sodomensis TaxID=1088 RepID=A0ABS1DA83_9PROT|nr:PH domain-containing protein [Rhodovibrio sodomensis]MBK1666513.1 hypothetical protein [Rhodovibrio sodomensis]